MISILIASIKRPQHIRACVCSVLLNTDKDFEIIVIDQNHNTETKNIIHAFHDPRIVHMYEPQKGKSLALNRGIGRARGNILVFIDDDCIVDDNWVKKIRTVFSENNSIVGVFGKTFPYQPENNRGKQCPCTFNGGKKRLISKPCYHAKYIGFGNNMAFRRGVFNSLGGFKTWLGPGSIGSNAEDAEFAQRILTKGYKVLYDPGVVVYHNKWLSQNQISSQLFSYACGEVACYGYYMFRGKQFAGLVVKDNFKDSYRKFRKILKKILLFQWKCTDIKHAPEVINEFFARLRGLIIARWFSIFDTMTST